MEIDWTSEVWSYLLGVIHGDGSIAPRSVTIAVGRRERDYAETLMHMLRDVGLDPKLYSYERHCLTISVNRRWLADALRPFKTKGIWSWPCGLHMPAYFSGVIDTDGCVTALPQRRVIVTLKRSGNLVKCAAFLTERGVPGVRVRDGTSKYNGKPYEIETLAIGSMEALRMIGPMLDLRHARKRERLQLILNAIEQSQADVPRWEQIGRWIMQEGPKTWDEIATQFNLNKRQVDSAIDNLRRQAKVVAIPPPASLTRYGVSDLRSFRGGQYARSSED